MPKTVVVGAETPIQVVGPTIHTIALRVQAGSSPGLIDITDEIAREVARSGIDHGVAHVFCRHTTCGLLINESEDGLAEDLKRTAAALVPDGYFAHDDLSRRTQNLQGTDEPPNGVAHVKQMLFGATSQMVPVIDGRLALGVWQRLLFVELDEPRPRKLLLSVLGA